VVSVTIMSDTLDGIIIGAAAAAIGTIVAMKFLNHQSFGGGEPLQTAQASPDVRGGVLWVQDVTPTDSLASPLAQNNPITEAAYNTGDIGYEPAFHNNYADHPPVLPM
jgi:hypothetical protein